MRKRFFPMLALTNIGKNSKFYFPYLLTCIGTAAMFYIMCFIAKDKGLDSMQGAASIRSMLSFGTAVVGIFAAIFLFYTNSFLMKRRQKELGLYNILGMEKRHIAKVMACETLFCAVITFALGLGGGILLSKLMLLILFRLLQFPIPIGFSVSGGAVLTTAALFCGIFFLTLLSNLGRIRLAKPIELLKGGQVGEREPKTKRLLAAVGLLAMGGGYAIALVTESPLSAIPLFFVAVLLVILGTYCLFTAGSIALLKLLRRNKKYYYETRHFIPVSGMIYRMKQNAAGLSNICILSTMVLVMVSGTVALYLGMENVLDNRYPTDISITLRDPAEGEGEETLRRVRETVAGQGRAISNLSAYRNLAFAMLRNGSAFTANQYNNTSGAHKSGAEEAALECMTAAQYEALTGKAVSLLPEEVMVHSSGEKLGDSFDLFGKTYHVVEKLETSPVKSEYADWLVSTYFIVVADEAELDWLCHSQAEAYRGNNPSQFAYHIAFDMDGTNEDKLSCSEAVANVTKKAVTYTETDEEGKEKTVTSYVTNLKSRQAAQKEFYGLYGGFLFLGLFLGTLFLMATVLIIYYKQVSEGYDDKERFEIMQKVGMSRQEVRAAIRSQILTVFFLPVLMAVLHIAAAFKMITKLLAVLNLTNIPLFFCCTVATVLAFILIYAMVYSLTARAYYRIVS